jgi:hypothetical protein
MKYRKTDTYEGKCANRNEILKSGLKQKKVKTTLENTEKNRSLLFIGKHYLHQNHNTYIKVLT